MNEVSAPLERPGRVRCFFRRGLYWPALVAVVFLSNIALAAWVIVASNSDPSFTVESDYYEKAINWNDEIDQRERNAALGWSVAVRGTPRMSQLGWADVTLTIANRNGASIDGARVTMLAFPLARGHETHELTLDQIGPGAYAARIDHARFGRWQLRVRAQRGDDLFTERLEARIEKAD